MGDGAFYVICPRASSQSVTPLTEGGMKIIFRTFHYTTSDRVCAIFYIIIIIIIIRFNTPSRQQ